MENINQPELTPEQEEQLWMEHYEQVMDYEEEKAQHLRWYYLVTN
jgi:hypothetical protein